MYENLKNIREEKGFTQEYMATKLGLKTKSAYCMKEKGTRKFTIEEAKVIANIFNTSIEEIFFNKEVANMTTKIHNNKYLETG